jgi:hypothetical protein
MMRSNSGKDESRNNLRDSTLRDRTIDRGDAAITKDKPKAPADHRGSRTDNAR